MNSRNIVRLFLSTLLVGGLTGGIVGFIVRWNEFEKYFSSFQIGSILSTFIWLFGVGLIFSVISQAGFFAYLTIHRFGLGIFKGPSLWNAVQVILLAFILFDLIYLRYISFGEGKGIGPYIGLAVFLLTAGLIVAYLKAKQTNMHAFIPAVFFMVAATTAEWVPVLQSNDEGWLYFMLFPLLACNAFQLLMLNPLIVKSQREREERLRQKTPLSGGIQKEGHSH
ncbi:KinB-signaling pathway activation protein [Bacillus massiliglaciei]|uniref:KinB-signaling pathway activation protein n=1 Tax=Bacillus massiliglaciei TaxID=1816693 RepID=UPI000AE3E9EB|nr:KinB-signaling pathway activation protein [Bacillus massiliglaciei]